MMGKSKLDRFNDTFLYQEAEAEEARREERRERDERCGDWHPPSTEREPEGVNVQQPFSETIASGRKLVEVRPLRLFGEAEGEPEETDEGT